MKFKSLSVLNRKLRGIAEINRSSVNSFHDLAPPCSGAHITSVFAVSAHYNVRKYLAKKAAIPIGSTIITIAFWLIASEMHGSLMTLSP